MNFGHFFIFWPRDKNLTIKLLRVGKIENHDSIFFAMANGKAVFVDSHHRLIANSSHEYPNEMIKTEIFLVHNNSDGSILLVSKANGLFVCLDVDLLIASCNESIRDHRRERFQIQCYSHWQANLDGFGDCKVFALHSISANRLVTIDLNGSEGDGLLRVSL